MFIIIIIIYLLKNDNTVCSMQEQYGEPDSKAANKREKRRENIYFVTKPNSTIMQYQ